MDGAEPAHDGSTLDGLRDLCRVAVTRLDLLTASVTVMGVGDVESHAAAADALGEELDSMQFALGEGPRHECFRTGRMLLEGDLGAERTQWPMFVAAAQERGVRAAYAVPVGLGAARLGVLMLYADQVRVLGAQEIAVATSCAETAFELLLGGSTNLEIGPGWTDGEDLGDLGRVGQVAAVRAEVYQAQGMVMVQLGVSLTEAMVRMRAHAWGRGVRLGVVASEIVDGRLVLPRWGDDAR